jgi:hypothetical protein
MEDRSSSLFDRVWMLSIAFLLPGAVVLFSVGTINTQVQTWFIGVSTGPAISGPTFAGLFFALIGALTLGFVITALRFLIFEVIPLKLWTRTCLVAKPAAFDEARRKDVAAEYHALQLNHYYHYLAMANLSVAIPIGVAIWKAGSTIPATGTTSAQGPTWFLFNTVIVIATIATIALARAACDAVSRYEDKRSRLLPLRTSA